MEKYNYLQNVINDVRTWCEENPETLNSLKAGEIDADEAAEQINDLCWISDSVTGNASGSYTFNTWEAEENLCHNLDLLEEACTEFGCNMGEAIERGAEYCDVTIRCYLLNQAVAEVLEEVGNPVCAA